MLYDFLSFDSFQYEISNCELFCYFLLMLCLNGQVEILYFERLSDIRPILLGLFLKLVKIYSSSWIMKIAKHYDGFDIFFVNCLPELSESFRSGGLGEDCKVLSIYDWFHVTGIDVEVIWTFTYDSAVIVYELWVKYRLEYRCIYFCWFFLCRWFIIPCKNQPNSGPRFVLLITLYYFSICASDICLNSSSLTLFRNYFRYCCTCWG